MTAHIKVANLPPAPEPTRAYRTPPPPPKGYDTGFPRKNIDEIKDGLYGVSDDDVDRPVKKKPSTRSDEKRKSDGKLIEYLRTHTRAQTAEHFGIRVDTLDKRMKSLRKAGYEIKFVREKGPIDTEQFIKDVQSMPIEDVAEKAHISVRSVMGRLYRLQDKGIFIAWTTRKNPKSGIGRRAQALQNNEMGKEN